MAANFASREGQRVPDVAFRVRRNGEWATMTSDELLTRNLKILIKLCVELIHCMLNNGSEIIVPHFIERMMLILAH